MARSRSNRKRDVLDITTSQDVLSAFGDSSLRQIEDRRRFVLDDIDPLSYPQGFVQKPFFIARPRYSVGGNKRNPFLSSRLSFGRPWDVVMCVRRKIRKQVLFAFKKTRKGARAKRHRWNRYSQYSCR